MSNTSLLGSYGGQTGDALMFRNRIINGDMRIDQRATAAATNTSYSVDRWRFVKSNDATESVAQNADAPTGFSYSLRHTISVADGTIAAAQFSGLEHRIEGYNIADFSFGTTNAQSITLQFWVRGTKVGQYTGVASNSDFSRNCPFNFNINTTNTWEWKTVTLPGCTDGSWNATNGIGLILQFSIALGSTYTTGFTAGTWNTNANCRGSGSPVNGLDSTANIFAITGVQLEAGPTATPFERRPIGTELALAQRYYYLHARGVSSPISQSGWYASTLFQGAASFPVAMRVAPDIEYSSGTNYYILYWNNTSLQIIAPYSSGLYRSTTNFQWDLNISGGLAGAVGTLRCLNAAAYVAFTAEL